jgi:hypothetical protein
LREDVAYRLRHIHQRCVLTFCRITIAHSLCLQLSSASLIWRLLKRITIVDFSDRLATSLVCYLHEPRCNGVDSPPLSTRGRFAILWSR